MRERNIYLWTGGAMLGLYVLVALFGHWIAPYGGNDQDLLNVLAAPSAELLLRSDQVGRVLLSRLIRCTRFMLTVAVATRVYATLSRVGDAQAAVCFSG